MLTSIPFVGDTPMPAYHATLWFAQPPLWGWVEQLWWEGPTTEQALQAALSLAQARYSILSQGVSLYRVSVSQPGIPRSGLSAPVRGAVIAGVPMPAVQAVEIRLQGPGHPPHRRSYALRGLPQGAVAASGQRVDWSPVYAGPANRWLRLLTQGGWRLLVDEPIGDPCPILGITVADPQSHDIYGGPLVGPIRIGEPQYLFLSLDGDIPVQVQRARIYGVRVEPNIRRLRNQVLGERDVLALYPEGCYVQGSTWGINGLSGGRVQFEGDQLHPIAVYDLVGLVARKCGPPPVGAQIPVQQVIGSPTSPAPLVRVLPRGIVGPGFPPPVPVLEFQTARDIVAEVFEGYTPREGLWEKTIGIAQVYKHPLYDWIVFVPGVDTGSFFDNFSDWVTALNSFLAVDDDYSEAVFQLIEDHTPPGARIFYAGHSLGGMTCQWVRKRRNEEPPEGPGNLVTFGSPAFASPFVSFWHGGRLGKIEEGLFKYDLSRNARYFGYRLDPVIWLGPGGFWAQARVLFIAATGGASELIVFLKTLKSPTWQTLLTPPDGVLPNLFRLHMSYPNSSELDGYNWSGTKDPDRALPPLQTGPVSRYEYIPPP